MICQNVCDSKKNQNQWLKWTGGLHDKVRLPRSISIKRKQISYIDIHLFSDASLTGVCTVAHAVVNQQNIFSQNLMTNKSRLAGKNLSIPCLELGAAHISANLTEKIFFFCNIKFTRHKSQIKKLK